ncbi:MAG TPA: hypothetical protein VD833_04680, partial [Vicinamibacterales bacterium]|nr:hypothetical protein [Vicinamibacterales bacterium]
MMSFMVSGVNCAPWHWSMSKTLHHVEGCSRDSAPDGVNNRELKEFLERIEVAIAMQQRVLFAQAERRDQAVDGLPHRMAP